MKSALRRMAARALTKGSFDDIESEILAALEQPAGAAEPQRIDRIVEHAVRNVPFYNRHSAQTSSLEDLPVVDKLMVKSGVEDFLRAGVDRSQLVSRTTSGSTGIPLTVYLDRSRARRNQAGVAASLTYAGADPFAPIVRARQWGRISARSRAVQILREHYPAHADRFDPADIAPLKAWVQKRKDVMFLGYPSYLEMVMRTLEAEGARFAPGNVRTLISAAEAPTPYFFAAARRLFGVQAYARYSSMEMGAMSISDRDDWSAYKFDTSSYHVEILQEDTDEPAAAGELGRLVVSDLHNLAMPLLRYDTGDMARFKVDDQGRAVRNTIVDLHGRRLDVLVGGTAAAPRKLHALAIWGPAAQISELRQFQLRQHDIGRFTWLLNAEPSAEIEGTLRRALDERVGDVVECRFEYVDEMPVLASGKRKFFVSDIDDPSALVEGGR
ncbi:hypothetical protein LG274_04955 [Micrococcus antarcticus]|uniref:hypothetical protein n=1 Tax=Micrococcus antarcticus TaxID=86171 RepID=UPI003262B48F